MIFFVRAGGGEHLPCFSFSFTFHHVKYTLLSALLLSLPHHHIVFGLMDTTDHSYHHHLRRHSQSVAMTTTIAGRLTLPQNRARSYSASCTPSLAAHLLASVNSKFREIEDADSSGFLRYMDDQVHETWDIAKAAVVGAQRLLQFHELPKEWQENEYVLSG